MTWSSSIGKGNRYKRRRLSRIPDPLLYCNCYTARCSVVPFAVHQIGSDVNRVHPVSSKEGSINSKSDADPYRYNLVFEGNGDFADSLEYPDGLPFIRQVVLPAIADDTNGTSLLSTYTSSEMRDLQLSDPEIGSMIDFVRGRKGYHSADVESNFSSTEAFLEEQRAAISQEWRLVLSLAG